MASQTIPGLPLALTISGGEYIWIIQNGQDYRIQLCQLGQIMGSSGGPPYAATPLGYQQITSLATAQALTVPAGTNFAYMDCENGDLRWRDDGTAPTGSVGMRIWAGQPPQLFSGDLNSVKFINVTAQTGTLNIVYYR